MRVFKKITNDIPGSIPNPVVPVALTVALACLRAYNAEFYAGKTDSEMIEELKKGPVYTNLNHYWIAE